MDEKKPRRKTGGRKPGSKNKRTLIGKDVAETLKNWLGFDNASVERTGMIDSDGYRGRQKLRAMWDGDRPIDPQYIVLAKFLFAYGYGTPGKMPVEGVSRTGLTFSMVHGHAPWDPAVDPMREQTAKMIKTKEEREQLLALEAAKGEGPVVIDVKKENGDTEIDAETLESVVPPPEPPDAFGGGGRGR